jgi:hypothetical protein
MSGKVQETAHDIKYLGYWGDKFYFQTFFVDIEKSIRK